MKGQVDRVTQREKQSAWMSGDRVPEKERETQALTPGYREADIKRRGGSASPPERKLFHRHIFSHLSGKNLREENRADALSSRS